MPRCSLSVDERNPARRLYERFGFDVVAVRWELADDAARTRRRRSSHRLVLTGIRCGDVSRMRAALSLDTLEVVPDVTFVVAIAAWSVAFAGLLHHLATNVVARRKLRC